MAMRDAELTTMMKEAAAIRAAGGFDFSHYVVTDFGRVRLSPQVIGYMDSLDPKWREITSNSRKRGRYALWLRSKLVAIESAAMILSEIKWAAGEEFDEL